MDFDDTPEEASFRTEARAWLGAHAVARDAATLVPGPPPPAHSDEEVEHVRRCREWQATLFDGGWAGITWPSEHGGRAGSAMQQLIFDQEQARFDVPTGVFAQGIGMAGPTLIAQGTPEQKARFLRPMLRGDELWCQLFSEPGAGSDLASLSTRAERDGEEFVVNGQKVWTSQAHLSDYGILLARTAPDAPRHRGISYFILDMTSPGIDVRPLRQITGSAHFNEVFLSDVRVPAANLVGLLNDGWAVAMSTLATERGLIAGIGRDVFPDLLLAARRAGRTADPALRQSLAAAYTRIQILKYLGWRRQTAFSRGEPVGPAGSIGKLAHSKNQATTGDLAVQLLGAAALAPDEHDPLTTRLTYQFIAQWSSRIGGGTDEIQRNIIGERVLGLPREPRTGDAAPRRPSPEDH